MADNVTFGRARQHTEDVARGGLTGVSSRLIPAIERAGPSMRRSRRPQRGFQVGSWRPICERQQLVTLDLGEDEAGSQRLLEALLVGGTARSAIPKTLGGHQAHALKCSPAIRLSGFRQTVVERGVAISTICPAATGGAA